MGQSRVGEGQTALITGASMGIGVDLAECFAQDGYDLILTARSEDALREVANRLAKAHAIKAAPIALDLAAHGGGTRLAQEIEARGLEVDVLVNNAGYGHAGAFANSDAATQLGMIDLTSGHSSSSRNAIGHACSRKGVAACSTWRPPLRFNRGH